MKPTTRNPQLVTNKGVITSASFLTILALLILFPLLAFSQVDTTITPESEAALDEELRWLKAETYVITPSRIPEKIKKTASSITVVTDRQIRQMGARNLMDVLRVVPGLDAYHGYVAYWMYDVRGVVSLFGKNVLLMINSHPVHENLSGGPLIYDTLPVDNIERIEFVRGPGSALYGANAVAVINVITKEADDIDGLEFTSRGGSFDTQQYNLLYGKTFNELEVVFNLNYFKTHGYRGHIEEDYAALIDQEYGTSFSRTPDDMKGDDESCDFSLTLKYKGFRFEGRNVDRETDFTVGNVPVLSEGSTTIWRDYYLNLSYEGNVWRNLDISAKVYRNHNRFRDDFQIWPPGMRIGPSTWPDGMLAISSVKNNRTGGEVQATYRMGDWNTLVTGALYEKMKQFDGNYRANVLVIPNSGVLISLPQVIDLSDIQPVYLSAKRNMKAFFFEDVWDITEDLRLTLGVRCDRYSDFGGEVSPRAGISWEFIKGYDLKLLYGHSFRAPNFLELTELGGGNPNLDPETFDTYEVSIGAEFTSYLSSRVTWFHSQAEDFIYPSDVTDRFENMGNGRGQGLEVEVDYDFGRGTYLALYYSYIRLISPHTQLRSWASAKHRGDIMANIRVSRYLNLNMDCYFQDGFRRDVGDSRDNMSGYAVVNATLIARKFLKGYEGLEVRGSVYNLLDKDYTHAQDPRLPHDLPRARRNFIIELKYKF